MTSTDDPRGPVPDATDAEALASALLDGEALPVEAAGASADDAAVLEARARFERVARAVATPVPIDDGAREAAIAAALGAAPAASQGDELARRRRSQGRLRVVGLAAAALVAVAIGAVALGQGGGDDADQAATATAEDRASSEVNDDAGGASSSADATTNLELSTNDLGAFDDLPALVAAAAADGSFSTDPPTTVAASGSAADEAGSAGDATPSAAGCAPPARPEGQLLSSRSATLEGNPVVVVVVDGARGRIVQVYDLTTCELRFEGSP